MASADDNVQRLPRFRMWPFNPSCLGSQSPSFGEKGAFETAWVLDTGEDPDREVRPRTLKRRWVKSRSGQIEGDRVGLDALTCRCRLTHPVADQRHNPGALAQVGSEGGGRNRGQCICHVSTSANSISSANLPEKSLNRSGPPS